MDKPNLYEMIAELADSHRTLSGDVRAFIARADERCKSHDAKTVEHHKTLFGNGTPGLKSRLEAIEVRAEMAPREADRRTNFKLAIVSGVFAIIAAAVALLK